jgi:hypothetical protein
MKQKLQNRFNAQPLSAKEQKNIKGGWGIWTCLSNCGWYTDYEACTLDCGFDKFGCLEGLYGCW